MDMLKQCLRNRNTIYVCIHVPLWRFDFNIWWLFCMFDLGVVSAMMLDGCLCGIKIQNEFFLQWYKAYTIYNHIQMLNKRFSFNFYTYTKMQNF